MEDQPVSGDGKETKRDGTPIRMAGISVAVGVALTAWILYQVEANEAVSAWVLATASVPSIVIFVLCVFFALSIGIAVAQITYDTLMLGAVEQERQRQGMIRQREAYLREHAKQEPTMAMGTPVPATGGRGTAETGSHDTPDDGGEA